MIKGKILARIDIEFSAKINKLKENEGKTHTLSVFGEETFKKTS